MSNLWVRVAEHTLGPLYHGSNIHPLEDNFVYPVEQGPDTSYGGQSIAFATHDLENAKNYGQYVYEVEPADDAQEGWGKEVYSEKGFKVKRLVHPQGGKTGSNLWVKVASELLSQTKCSQCPEKRFADHVTTDGQTQPLCQKHYRDKVEPMIRYREIKDDPTYDQ